MRQPKPFFRKQTQSWYVQIGKRQVSLGNKKEEAFSQYHELMSRDDDLNYFQSTVVQLLDMYLDWCESHRATRTFKKALHYCHSFIDCVGKQLKIRHLKPKHITEWMDNHPNWSNNTQNDAITVIQRAFNWAKKQGHIDRSPIPYIEDKPQRTRREVVYSPAQVATVIDAIKDQDFKDLLIFLWETGCRPKEATDIRRAHVDLASKMVVLPASLNKTKKAPRVIFLNDRAAEVLSRQMESVSVDGTVFRNQRGLAWNKDSINCRFQRLNKKLGFKRLCAYGCGVRSLTAANFQNSEPR